MTSLVSLASHLILLAVVLRAGEVPVGAIPTVQTQSAQASTAESQVKAARKLVDDGKPKEAIAKLEALDTSVPEVARLLGVAADGGALVLATHDAEVVARCDHVVSLARHLPARATAG